MSPPSPIVSSSPELLVQFVSDLSVTADGFSATYTLRDRGSAPETPATKPRGGGKGKPPPIPKAGTPTAPPDPGTPCPQRCRRAGTLQSNFCSSDFGENPPKKTGGRTPRWGRTPQKQEGSPKKWEGEGGCAPPPPNLGGVRGFGEPDPPFLCPQC